VLTVVIGLLVFRALHFDYLTVLVGGPKYTACPKPGIGFLPRALLHRLDGDIAALFWKSLPPVPSIASYVIGSSGHADVELLTRYGL